MSKKWLWLTIGAVVVLAVVSLVTSCAPSKPSFEHATQGQRLQDDAVATKDAEVAKPEGKYRTGQIWQDCENRAYVKIVELLSPESPEKDSETDPFGLVGDYDLNSPKASRQPDEDRSRLDSNPYVHILRLDDNTTESYRKKDFEKRFRYAPEGSQ